MHSCVGYARLLMKIVGKRLQTHLPLELQLMAQNSTTSAKVLACKENTGYCTSNYRSTTGTTGCKGTYMRLQGGPILTHLPLELQLMAQNSTTSVASTPHAMRLHGIVTDGRVNYVLSNRTSLLPCDVRLPCDIVLPCNLSLP